MANTSTFFAIFNILYFENVRSGRFLRLAKVTKADLFSNILGKMARVELIYRKKVEFELTQDLKNEIIIVNDTIEMD